MITGVSKSNLLFSVVDILKAEPTVTSLVPKRNIKAGTSVFNNLQASIDVIDGGDEIQSEIRRRVSIQVVIKTKVANINRSDLLCSDIESAIINCLLANQNLSGAVSRFIEGSSEEINESDDPNIRTRIVKMTYEYM